jgi:hypothetical protein
MPAMNAPATTASALSAPARLRAVLAEPGLVVMPALAQSLADRPS